MAFTLDEIRAAAEKKYADFELEFDGETIKLLNALRLPKEKRDAVLAVQEELGEEGADQAALMAKAVELVAEDGAAAKRLLKAIGNDLAVLAELFAAYSGATAAGEA